MPLVRGPSDPDAFRVSVHGARWYKDPLPADGRWGEMQDAVPAVTTIKKAWNKPFRKRTPTGLVVPLDAYRAAQYVADNLSQLSQMHPEQAFTLVATAPENDLAKAAQRGTGVHSVIEAMAAGQVVSPDLHDDDVRPFLPACQAFVDEWRPVWHMTEFIVIERRLGFAGTADALVEFPDAICPTCGEPFGLTLVDWKSRGSAHGAYPEEVCQLGGYSLGEYIIVSDDQGQPVRREPPEVNHAAIVSITADDGYRLYPVEIPIARKAFLGLFETWRIRRDGESTARQGVGLPALPPTRLDAVTQKSTDSDVDHSSHSTSAHVVDESVDKEGDSDGVPERHSEPSSQPHSPVEDAHLSDVTFVAALTQWLRSRVVVIVGAGRPLPLSWPVGVPTFKSGEPMTPEHLQAVERWCDDTEAMLGLPFPLDDRPESPSEDEMAPVEPGGPPRPSRGDLARAEAEQWAERGRGLLALLGDEQLARACAAVAQCDDVVMTRERYLSLAAVVMQVTEPAGVLVAHWSGSGVELRPLDDIELALLAQMPDAAGPSGSITKKSKLDALRRAKRVAKKLAVPSPATYEDLCNDRLLAACVAMGHGANP